MSLRKRVLKYFVITNLILIFIFLFIFRVFILSSLKKQEKLYEEKLIRRTEKVINDYLENYYIMSYNWGEWDSMHDFVENPNYEFIKNNFPEETFGWDFLDLVVIKDLSGKTIYSSFMEPESRKFKDYKKLGIDKHTKRIIKELIKNFPKEENKVYFFKTDYGVLLSVFQPITTNKATKPNGILILGGVLGKHFEEQLKSFLLENLNVWYWGSKVFKKIVSELQNTRLLSSNIRERKNNLYYLIHDIERKPVVIIKISYDTKIFKVLSAPLMYSIVGIIVWWILLGIFLYFVIDKFITGRVLSIASYMTNIKETKDLNLKIKEDNFRDEISCLIKNINSAIEELRREKEEKEKAEKQMINSEKLAVIGRMASVLSHELNSPLLALSNSIEVLKNSCKIEESEEFKAIIEISEREIKYIRELIEGLLAVHKKKLKKFKFFSINELIQESTSLLKIMKKISNVKINISFKEDCKVYGSPSELKQVILNFLINSIEAMKGEGQILIKGWKENKYCILSIKDSGPGLDEGIRNKLFEPFVFSDKKDGIGLGLYVSYKIVGRHNGEIVYLNEDDGAHFLIKLPMFKYRGGKVN